MPASRDWAVGLVLVACAVALVVHLSATDAEFSRHNPSWNGSSSFYDALEARGAVEVGDPADLAGRTGSTLLVVAPSVAPGAADAARYREFVRSGNTLVLLDDFASGNGLLDAVGATMRFDQRGVLSLERAYELPDAPLGYPVAGAALAENLSAVVFNRPVAVTGGAPLLETSPLSWVDLDGDGVPALDEPFGRFTLAATEQVGAGTIVAVGDASLVINAMQNLREGDNARLLARLAPDGVLVDGQLGRTAAADGPVGTVLWLQERPFISIAVVALALAALALRQERRRVSGA